MPEVVVRKMSESDLDHIMEVQSECYTEIEPESRNSLRSKLRVSSDTCWVAEIDRSILAYLMCHPWESGSVPPLDTELSAIPGKELFYFHDLAVGSQGRGLGLARMLVETALSFARNSGFEKAGLIAVQGSSLFWSKFAFEPSTSLNPEGVLKLKSYGAGALYMEIKSLSSI